MSVRVLIVDDHAVVRAGLRMLIDAEDDLEAVHAAEDGSEDQRYRVFGSDEAGDRLAAL